MIQILLIWKLLTSSYALATWKDAVITPKVTIIKAEHIQELRAAVNGKRVSCGLAEVKWKDDPIVAGETRVQKSHIDELRLRFLEIPEANVAYAKTSGFSDLTIAKGMTPIKAIHVTELRSAIDALVCAAVPPPVAPPKCPLQSFSMRCGKLGCTIAAWNQFMSALTKAESAGVNIGTVKTEASSWANPPLYGGKTCKPFTPGSRYSGSSGDISYNFIMEGTEDLYTEPFRSQKGMCIITYEFQCL